MKVETQILANLRILMQYRDTKGKPNQSGGEETKEGPISAIQIKTLASSSGQVVVRTPKFVDECQQNRFAGFVACPAEKPFVGQFIDMKIAGNISANLEACKGDMSNRGALPDNVQNDN
ncbi:hypothetical protein YC2023_022312 [Brassica napus]